MCFTGEQICRREKLLFCTGDYNMENGSKFYMVKKKALPEILLKVGSKCSSKQRKGKNNQRGD